MTTAAGRERRGRLAGPGAGAAVGRAPDTSAPTAVVIWGVSGATHAPAAGRDGPTEHLLGRLGHRYAGTARAVAGALIALLAPFAGPPAGPPVCAVVSLAFVAWSVHYARQMRGGPAPYVWLLDLAVVGGLCLAQPLLVDPVLVGLQLGWVAPIVSFTVVVVQWHARPWPAAAATVGLALAYVIGAGWSAGFGTALLAGGGAWMLAEAVLSRLIWHLVRRGGRLADTVMEERFEQEREATTESARRAEQRRQWATVHDTAASTLLMVGLGEVSGREPWLHAQLQRDITALDGEPREAPAPGLAEALAATIMLSPIRIRLEIETVPPASAALRLPPPVVAAVSGAMGEALENVRRHAGTGRATLQVHHTPDVLRIEIGDEGPGFDPDAVPVGRAGLEISIRARMAEVGGCARLASAPGAGTRIMLEWCGEPGVVR